MSLPPRHIGTLTSLIFFRSTAIGSSWVQQPCHLQKIIYHRVFLCLPILTIFLPPLLQCFLSLVGKECDIDVSFRSFYYTITYFLHLDQSLGSVLTFIHCKKEASLISDSFTNGYKKKYLGGSLIVCPLSKIIAVGLSLRLTTKPDTSSWPGLQYQA